MKRNRCGLGQTAMNPIVTTINNFRSLYERRIEIGDARFNPAFDLPAAVKDYDLAVAKA